MEVLRIIGELGYIVNVHVEDPKTQKRLFTGLTLLERAAKDASWTEGYCRFCHCKLEPDGTTCLRCESCKLDADEEAKRDYEEMHHE